MSDCVLCKCDNLAPGPDNCEHLHQQNDEKIREFAIIYRDLQACNLAEYGAKGFYNVWCMFKNLTAQVCWLTAQAGGKAFSLKGGKGITVTESGGNYTISSTVEPTEVVAGDGITVTTDGQGRKVITNSNPPVTLKAGSNITVTGGGREPYTISATVPKPDKVDLSGYVPVGEYNKLKNTLKRIVDNLEGSGAWSGGLDGDFRSGRNIATGNINIFGGTPDGSSFIRTNSGSTENDLAGGI